MGWSQLTRACIAADSIQELLGLETVKPRQPYLYSAFVFIVHLSAIAE